MESPARVVVAHPGNSPYIHNAVLALAERGELEYFATTYLDHPDYSLSRFFKALAKALRPSYVRQLERRSFTGIPFTKIRTHPLSELIRTFSSKVLRAPLLTDVIWERQDHNFDRWVARGLTADVDAVYTFEHAALRTIQAAREKGVFSFYEQPSQHHAFFGKVLREQLSRYPELANAHTGILLDSKTVRRNRRRDEELLLADCVLCNSQFTRRTLTDAGVDGRKIEVTPIGFPRPLPSSREATGGPVIFLNAGIQSLRKGVHLLYRAWRSLSFREDEAELWLVGKMELPESLRRDLPGRVRITESMPRKDLMQLYGHASVLVLPSLADGFGMVVTEAMSRGLPAIVTTDTGTSDVITHGNSGFVIPPGDEAALAAQMRWCVEHREELPAMGAAALATAEQWQWADYRRALASLISRKLRERSELVGGREAPGRGAANARPNHAAAGGSEIGH